MNLLSHFFKPDPELERRREESLSAIHRHQSRMRQTAQVIESGSRQLNQMAGIMAMMRSEGDQDD